MALASSNIGAKTNMNISPSGRQRLEGARHTPTDSVSASTADPRADVAGGWRLVDRDMCFTPTHRNKL